jgi:hypothetical protein
MASSVTVGSGLFTNKKPIIPHKSLPNKELGDLRKDIGDALLPMAAITAEEWTDPPAAVANAILTAKASIVAATTYLAAALDGAVGAAVMVPPRNITVTTAGTTPADAPATVVITGIDINGNAQTDTITVAQTATIALGTKAFKKVTSIAFAASEGTGATMAVGFGSVIGLSKKIKTRAGLTTAIMEIAGGSKVTNGTFVAAATSGPNGTYAPNTIPDGSVDYSLLYSFDPLA